MPAEFNFFVMTVGSSLELYCLKNWKIGPSIGSNCFHTQDSRQCRAGSPWKGKINEGSTWSALILQAVSDYDQGEEMGNTEMKTQEFKIKAAEIVPQRKELQKGKNLRYVHIVPAECLG